MNSIYEKCSDKQLKEAVEFIIKNKNYKPNKYTNIINEIISFKYTLSDKQRHMLINHLITNEKII